MTEYFRFYLKPTTGCSVIDNVVVTGILCVHEAATYPVEYLAHAASVKLTGLKNCFISLRPLDLDNFEKELKQVDYQVNVTACLLEKGASLQLDILSKHNAGKGVLVSIYNGPMLEPQTHRLTLKEFCTSPKSYLKHASVVIIRDY